MTRATIFIEEEPPVVIKKHLRSRRITHLSHGLVAEHGSGDKGSVTLKFQQIEPGSNPPIFQNNMIPFHDFTGIEPGMVRASPEALFDNNMQLEWKHVRVEHDALP